MLERPSVRQCLAALSGDEFTHVAVLYLSPTSHRNYSPALEAVRAFMPEQGAVSREYRGEASAASGTLDIPG